MCANFHIIKYWIFVIQCDIMIVGRNRIQGRMVEDRDVTFYTKDKMF